MLVPTEVWNEWNTKNEGEQIIGIIHVVSPTNCGQFKMK